RRTRGEEVEEEALDVTPLLKELVSLPAIDGVILLEKDGLTIASEGVEESEELAAIISGIANQSLTTGSEFNIGDLESFTVITPHRRFINIVGPDAILTLISGPDGGEGLATLYGTKIHSRIISILGR
ncbi:MAG TPA: hypothetical protein EYP24_00400, partial [bacterium (Candidatus Stahlbacteria)]|nr:hypothetical protein [Candidatus Stahlbacteria bacterium]